MEKRRLLEEKLKRLESKADRENQVDKLKKRLFTKQLEVFNAMMGAPPSSIPKRYPVVNCTRRAGKSDLVTTAHVSICLLFPGSRTIMAGLTLDSISAIAWDLLLSILDSEGVIYKTNSTKKIIFYSNGSQTRLIGIDAKEREMRKVLGQKLRFFSLDESGSVNVDVALLMRQMVNPALTDLRPYSWLMMVGTCEIIPNTYFEQVTEKRNNDFPWKVWKWTAYDNPFMHKQWSDEIRELLENNPLIKIASWFRTHYLNEWCPDDELKILDLTNAVYEKFDPKGYRNAIYGIGVDLGFNDDSSFVVGVYSREKPWLHVVKTFKIKGRDLTDVANIIKKLQKDYPISLMVIDGANKQGVEEIRNRHTLPLIAAEKHGKATYLRLLKDDISTGYVHIDEDECKAWLDEARVLVWDKDDPSRTKEDPRCENHCNDAVLYLWRECRAYISVPDQSKVDKNTDEYMKIIEEEEAEEALMEKNEREEENDGYTG